MSIRHEGSEVHHHADADARRIAVRRRSGDGSPPAGCGRRGRVPRGACSWSNPRRLKARRLRDVLSSEGLEVHVCSDLAAAAEAVPTVQPALILARWDSPTIGRPEPDPVRRLLEAAATPAWVPVILHGVCATVEDRIAALDLGALDALASIPGDAELLARLRGRCGSAL